MIKNNQKIPEGWSVKKLGEVSLLFSGGTPSKTEHKYWDNGNIKWLSAKYIEENKVIGWDYITEAGLENSSAKLAQINDIILVTRVSVGKIYFCEENYAVNQDLTIIRSKSVNSNFLFFLVKNKQNVITDKSQGLAIKGITKEELSNISLLIPPLAEQEKIAGILGTWDEAIEKLSSLIEQKKLLKKGLMQRLLTGKTRLSTFTQPWEEVKLGDICKISTGKKDVNEGNPDGLYPFFTCAKINTFSDTFSFDQEAILIAGNGEVGHCQYYNGKFEAYQRTYILSDFTLSALLLFQYLNYFFKQRIDEQKQQGAMPYIKLKTLIDFHIYIPRDKNEQNSLLSILSTADEEINLLNKKLEALKEQKKGLMQQLLTGQTRVKVN